MFRTRPLLPYNRNNVSPTNGWRYTGLAIRVKLLTELAQKVCAFSRRKWATDSYVICHSIPDYLIVYSWRCLESSTASVSPPDTNICSQQVFLLSINSIYARRMYSNNWNLWTSSTFKPSFTQMHNFIRHFTMQTNMPTDTPSNVYRLTHNYHQKISQLLTKAGHNYLSCNSDTVNLSV